VVVRAFGYSMKNAFLVGMSLAQIGEFAFILLSRASNLHLIQVSSEHIILFSQWIGNLDKILAHGQ
jgi:predicted Kef-type K+ transport protein